MRAKNRRCTGVVATASILLLLAACGGKDGGSNNNTPDSETTGNHTTGDDGSDSGSDSGATAAVTLSWVGPTKNEDGTCLNDLAGFRVKYGLSPDDYSEEETVGLGSLSITGTGPSSECGTVQRYRYTVNELDSASWYFAVAAMDDSGNVSDLSNEVIYTVE